MFGLLRMPRFVRRFIRRRTNRMPVDKAIKMKERFSLAYAFFAWNMFGILAYMMYKGKLTKVEDGNEESQGRQFVKMLHLKNVTLHEIKGINYVQKYDLNEEAAHETGVPETGVTNEDQEQFQEESELKDSL
ncbi:uncharacterized protein LOC135106510 isoform X2 [Scylla paramamosain]